LFFFACLNVLTSSKSRNFKRNEGGQVLKSLDSWKPGVWGAEPQATGGYEGLGAKPPAAEKNFCFCYW